MADVQRIVLIGFSGSGKSTVARLLAERLDWRAVDTDAGIEKAEGKTVPEIFAIHGEPYFRNLERRALMTGLASDQTVIATGGGAVVADELWTESALHRPGTLVVALDVEPETVFDRLRRQQEAEGAAVERPMIAGEEPLTRIREPCKSRRQPIYDRADITLIVDRVSPEHLVGEIEGLIEKSQPIQPAVTLQVTSATSNIYIKPGLSVDVGALIADKWPKAKRAWVISDANVGELHGPALLESIGRAGLATDLVTVPVGESSKSWTTAGSVLDHLLDGGIERGDVVAALGGGVIGDLVGFVAATVLRGVPLVQIPTSLLAMVDSSIGGKTGVNHRTGKNLIGAFYQPPLVLIDPALLRTLPPRDLNTGWAEIVKHAVIQQSTPGGERADLLRFLERNQSSLKALSEPAISYAIARNVALKAAVVEHDEKETGIRAYLNFGHTLGHGIEASDYRLLHGEAVALGMRAVLRLALELGATSSDYVDRVDHLLDGFELPRTAPVDREAVLARMTSDKKRVAGRQRWVLPAPNGDVEIRIDIPDDAIMRALDMVTSTAAADARL